MKMTRNNSRGKSRRKSYENKVHNIFGIILTSKLKKSRSKKKEKKDGE